MWKRRLAEIQRERQTEDERGTEVTLKVSNVFVGGRRAAGLRASQTADLLEFSHHNHF